MAIVSSPIKHLRNKKTRSESCSNLVLGDEEVWSWLEVTDFIRRHSRIGTFQRKGIPKGDSAFRCFAAGSR